LGRSVALAFAFAASTALGTLGGCTRAKPTGGEQSAGIATASAEAAKALAPSAAVVAPSAAAATNAPAVPAPCDALCGRTAALRCGASAEECLAGCQEMASATVCQKEMLAALRCMSAHPIGDWECDQSMASIRPGFCETEQSLVAACISRPH
jgi:hypothetical protein